MSTISLFGTLVDTIKSHYELPEILTVAVMPSLRSHTSGPDSVYQITTNSKSYVLRPFRTEIGAAIELHNQFLHWAELSDFSITQGVVRTREGKDFFDCDNQRWWLSSYIEADPVFEWTKPTWSKEICEQSGKALLSLHQALRRFAKENPSILSSATNGSALLGLEIRLLEAFSKSENFAHQSKLIVPLVSKALVPIQASENVIEQLVHGDFHPGNLLFKGGVTVAIIDFEYLNVESPIYDLAYALLMFCAHWTDGRIDMEKLQSFLRAYVSDVLEFDLHLLLPYMNVAAAICLTWFLERDMEVRTVQHFINVVKQLENLSTMDISRAIGRT